MRDLLYNNVRLEPGVSYFLYVGELKARCLNDFAREAMSDLPRNRTKAISIIQDATFHLEHDLENVMAINPDAAAIMRDTGVPTACRIPSRRFLEAVSESPEVFDLVNSLLERQPKLYIWMFESLPELRLTDMNGVELLGPDPELSHRFNNKIRQYNLFRESAPVVDYHVCKGRRALLELTESLRDEWTDGIFVSYEYSAAGMGSMVTSDQKQVRARFHDPEAHYLVSRFIPHEHDPTVLAVAAGSDEVFVAGVADQRIENQNSFRGSTWPSILPEETQRALCEHTAAVGKLIAAQGYRGIYGCDFIVDNRGDIYFIEVNTRKQGTTMEFCCAMEHCMPPGAPSLMALERHAVLEGGFPEQARPILEAWPPAPRPGLHWGSYNHKTPCETMTVSALGQSMPERELFARVAAGGPGEALFLEHVGQGARVMPGAFVGRVAAVDSTRQGMLRRLAEAEQTLRRCTDPQV